MDGVTDLTLIVVGIVPGIFITLITQNLIEWRRGIKRISTNKFIGKKITLMFDDIENFKISGWNKSAYLEKRMDRFSTHILQLERVVRMKVDVLRLKKGEELIYILHDEEREISKAKQENRGLDDSHYKELFNKFKNIEKLDIEKEKLNFKTEKSHQETKKDTAVKEAGC